jgi:hypothetical protein
MIRQVFRFVIEQSVHAAANSQNSFTVRLAFV